MALPLGSKASGGGGFPSGCPFGATSRFKWLLWRLQSYANVFLASLPASALLEDLHRGQSVFSTNYIINIMCLLHADLFLSV